MGETDEEYKVQARRDRDDYYLAMINGEPFTCYTIEQKYNLEGYPPDLVTLGLNAASNGIDPESFIETYIADRDGR